MALASLGALKKLYDSVNGRTEHPPNSNRIFVWAYLIRHKLAAAWFMGQSYCAGGQVWTLARLKIAIPKVSSPFYCPSRVQWARAHGRYKPIHQGKAGDEVFYAWTQAAQRSGLAEHVGRLVKDVEAGDTVIHTFEFNTSAGVGGSQANGDGCFYRQRPIDATVLGVLVYHDFFTAGAPKHAPNKRVRRNPYLKALKALRGNALPVVQGAGMHHPNGSDVVRGIQWAIGVPVNGKFDADTDHAVRLFQRYHSDGNGRHLLQDGEVGALTLGAVLKITHFQH